MQLKSIVFAAACVAGVAKAQYPPLDVQVDGVDTTLYVQYPYWSEATTSGSSMSYDYNNRMYLSTSASLDTSAYFMPSLVGGSIEFDVDVSQAGCGCITALYSVVMPAEANSSDPFKYCDGASVGGYPCPEFDMMEANKYAWRSTAHKCDGNGSSYWNCDKPGTCSTDVLTDKPSGVFGPGSSSGINTNQPFHMKQEFHEDAGQFTGYTTTLTQGDREVVLSKTNCGSYLSQMTTDMSKMVFAISNWGSGSLDWLQHGACTGSCSTTNTLSTLSNLQFFSGGASPNPGPGPDPEPVTEYAYGDDCTNLDDQDCALVDCAQCSWSWPLNDPATWQSLDALCRCQVEDTTPNPQPEPVTEYAYGDDCTNLNDQDCALVDCAQCSWSWPIDDPATWQSSDALCRCQREVEDEPEPVVYVFGDDCTTSQDDDCVNSDCLQCSWSWPSNDPAQWNSSDALCRCQREATANVVPVFKYGNECNPNRHDVTLCGANCENCHKSWPINDPEKWKSDDAACRCMPKQRATEGYTFGNNQCKKNTSGICDGEEDCRWSWPSDDALKWSSDEAMCRPKPTTDVTYDYSGDCGGLYDQECGADCHRCEWSYPRGESWDSPNAACRCASENIREVVFGDECQSLDDGLCGTYCRECRWSWEATDSFNGDSATCRCRNWW